VSVYHWPIPVRMDRRCGTLDLMRSGRIRFTRTPLLSEYVWGVGSRSNGQEQIWGSSHLGFQEGQLRRGWGPRWWTPAMLRGSPVAMDDRTTWRMARAWRSFERVPLGWSPVTSARGRRVPGDGDLRTATAGSMRCEFRQGRVSAWSTGTGKHSSEEKGTRGGLDSSNFGVLARGDEELRRAICAAWRRLRRGKEGETGEEVQGLL
jgi:hypothetical protein